jgi:hypothetical protein
MHGNALAPVPGSKSVGGRAPDAHTPPNVENHQWTTATDDMELVDHLLNVYFTWQHSFFQSFPEELFRDDYKAGRTKYCSEMLVNAICAAGCLLSDRPEAYGDPNDPQSAGSGFFDEGMKLLNQVNHSSIPTTAAVFILSHVEGYRGRLGIMWGLVGRSTRMALDLDLHRRNEKTAFDQLNPRARVEEAGRLHTFWGCFISDQYVTKNFLNYLENRKLISCRVTSMTLGRLPQVFTNAITVDLPPLDDKKDAEPWGPEGSPSRKRPGARAITFRECASFSIIVNSTLLMFFAPSQVISGRLLLDEHKKYQDWYKRLPDMLASTDDTPAHVLCLQ